MDSHRVDSGCPSGYIVCNEYSDRDFQFCAPTVQECPITDIKFTDYSGDFDSTYTYQTYNSYYYFGYSKDTETFPVTYFKLTEEMPCLDVNEFKFSEGAKFDLDTIESEDCPQNE